MASSSNNINTSSPTEKYPCPTELNVLDFVPKLLPDRNYERWKKSMQGFIKWQGLTCFIDDGTAEEERSRSNQEFYKAWKKSDNLVQGWILTTLPEDFRLCIWEEDLKTATALWVYLERKLEMPESSNINTSSPTKRYPCPTELNVLDFVPKLVFDKNYERWKKSMQGFIKWQGLTGFIDGTAVAEESIQDSYEGWKRSDNLVQGWILATFPEDFRLRVWESDLKTATILWMSLERVVEWKHMTGDEEEDQRLAKYAPLMKAAIKGDWDEAAPIIQRDPHAATTPINDVSETALMVAIKSAGRNHFVGKLLEHMTPQDVLIADAFLGHTALHKAAKYGNIEGAKMLVHKNPHLPNVKSHKGNYTPLHLAAQLGMREMVIYLMQVTSEDIQLAGARLLRDLTVGELYDIASTLLEQKPELAREEPSPLHIIVEKKSSFKSGNSFNFLENLVYLGLPMKSERIADRRNGGGGREGDIESHANCCISVPRIKCIQEKKFKQHHALELVKVLCREIAKTSVSDRIYRPAMQVAARIEVPEVFEQIVLSSPTTLYLKNLDGKYIFQDAILWRRERVYNLIYQTTIPSQLVSDIDNSGNNGLHMAALLGDEQQINLKASVPIAVLQMQRELQWFKEVEKFTKVGHKDRQNADGLRPAELFSKTHQDLIKESEHWMNNTATSCTIVAALIATMVFAAAITVPGGNNDQDGHPILSKHKAFIIFGIADALALFSSITSVLMFLLILTSRYAEEDFLYTLPSRLVIGLITLFFSILCTMVTSGAILFLVFGGNKAWILIPLVALASIPTTLFGAMQFPLLVEIIKSTYGRGIFGKKSDRILI